MVISSYQKLVRNKNSIDKRPGIASEENTNYAEQPPGETLLWHKGNQTRGRPGNRQVAEADLRSPIKASGF